MRDGTCLRLREPWLTDLSKVTEPQWRRVISNIFTTGEEENRFRVDRQRNLTQAMFAYNQQNNQQYNINQILAAIVNAAQTGQNVSLLPVTNPIRVIYDVDASLHQERASSIRTKLENMHATYLRCQAGQSQVQPPAPRPRSMMPGGPGFGAPGSQVGGPMVPAMGQEGAMGQPGTGGMPGAVSGAAQGGISGSMQSGRSGSMSGTRTGTAQGAQSGRQPAMGQGSRDFAGSIHRQG